MKLSSIALGLTALGLTTLAAAPAATATNLVSNGSFEQSSYTVGHQFGAGFGGQGVTDWTATAPNGYQAYLFPATATNTDFISQYSFEPQRLAATFPGASPDGGNFLGLDGDYQGGVASPIVQTINGLTAGETYNLTFYWAGTQLTNRTGPTTERIDVLFGNSAKSTKTVDVASQGFVGWTKENFAFTAGGTSQLLSFAAHGTPSGLPPFAVLDGVSLTAAVPDAATWVLLIVGFGLVGVTARRQRTVAA